MTVSELKKQLDKLPDDAHITITLNCDNSFHNVDEVRFSHNLQFGIIESFDIPNDDDLASLIEAALAEHRGSISNDRIRLLEAYLDTFIIK